ncbi:CCA tRNA nucleotidyltransferase [Maritimibacter sp. 55A14]|uniref:CCA tRNA nucleotidyltransferase n=1 Tax=Maritimibacter sp. 55A14 TaxID=2174844 RepID=UPI001E328CF9|nr:CCA tRNA nucleotidyltransferase [Maritimibacter sp. 55A14]
MTRVTGPWLERPATQTVLGMLEAGGHQALAVGGCVRNALLGEPVSDVDIATDARPERVMALARAAGLRPVPTGVEHGTVTVVADGTGYEVTTFRHDVETDGRRAVVAFADELSDDAHRRDFTMNALYARADGTVIDPLGGLADLNARRVRFIDDPAARIREDYLRILRFFRFHAWYGDAEAGLDRDGLAACAELAGGLDSLSRERVGAELSKLLAAPDPAPGVAAMAQAGILARILPGADPRALPLLVHCEGAAGIAADWRRRLAALGGAPDNLRLSRKDARRVALLRTCAGSSDTVAALGYRHGAEAALDIALLRAALLETPLPADAAAQAARGAAATFPVAARDLMPGLDGPELGERLKWLEEAWIASDFTLTRAELLAGKD